MKKIILLLMIGAGLLWALPSHAEWGNNIGTQGLKYASISTATTTVIKSAFCFIHTLTVTGGTAGTISLYANQAASTPVVAYWSSTNNPNSYLLDINAASGCTVVTSAATDLTISYL